MTKPSPVQDLVLMKSQDYTHPNSSMKNWWRVRTTHIPIQVWKWFFMLPPDYCFTKWVWWMLALSPWNMANGHGVSSYMIV